MQPYQQQVLEDQAQLALRCDRLVTFMMGETFLGLSDRERGLLATQLVLMRQYNDILIERMKAWA
jgi:hypothetical protein